MHAIARQTCVPYLPLRLPFVLESGQVLAIDQSLQLVLIGFGMYAQARGASRLHHRGGTNLAHALDHTSNATYLHDIDDPCHNPNTDQCFLWNLQGV